MPGKRSYLDDDAPFVRPASGTNGSLSSDLSGSYAKRVKSLSPAPRTELGRALDDVASFIRRFVFKDRRYADVLALWRIAHTWAFEAATVTPYLWLYSNEMGSGKTRTLEVIELLVRAPWRAIESTEAVLFRKIAVDVLEDRTTVHQQAREPGPAESLRAIEGSPWSTFWVGAQGDLTALARCLGEFRIKSKNVRLGDETSRATGARTSPRLGRAT
jgi:hypothetical protein